MRNKLGIIGFPLNKTLSPKIQKTIIKGLNLNLTYNTWPIEINQINLFLDKVCDKRSDILGFNVTIPYKEKIIPFLDKLTKNASIIGAVNTVKFFNNKLIGDNTDGQGLIKSLLNENIKLKNKKILIIGTGGAAKGISISIALNSYNFIDLIGRNILEGNLLKERIKKIHNCKSEFYSLKNINKIDIVKYDLIIQTTNINKNFLKIFSEFPFNKLKKTQILIDIIYNPLITEYLKIGFEKKMKIINGIGMLIEQGLLSFKFWTGKNVINNINIRKNILNNLEEIK